MRILVIGAGPTGISAAWRLAERGHDDWLLVEGEDHPGGLATSVRDANGFTWDLGGHVLFSHYPYFDALMYEALGDAWVEHEREAWVWMRERWVPYPFQNNIWRLPPEELTKCLEGLLAVQRRTRDAPPVGELRRVATGSLWQRALRDLHVSVQRKGVGVCPGQIRRGVDGRAGRDRRSHAGPPQSGVPE